MSHDFLPNSTDRQRLMHSSLVCLILAFASGSALAQRPTSPKQSLAVDEVRLTNGKRMYGIILENDSKRGVMIVVEREWFEQTYPTIYAEHVNAEKISAGKALAAQLKRLGDWKKLRAADQELVEFIDEEISRIKLQYKQIDQPDQPGSHRFTVVSYPVNEFKEVFVQQKERHHVAGCAWKHGVKRVTTRTFAALRRDLEKLNIDIENETVDLSAEVTSSQLQSDAEWSSRVALFEYVLRKRLDFQGMGTNLFKIDPDKPANPQALLQQIMGGGLGLGGGLGNSGLVDELLRELHLDGRSARNSMESDGWWAGVTKSAEADGYRGVRITRVQQDYTSPTAKVENYFFALIQPGQWRQIIHVSATANRSQVDAGELEQIKNDPQVKKVVDMFRGLGINSDEMIETAIWQGAATQIAMQESEHKFFEIVNRYTVRTDGPPLGVK